MCVKRNCGGSLAAHMKQTFLAVDAVLVELTGVDAVDEAFKEGDLPLHGTTRAKSHGQVTSVRADHGAYIIWLIVCSSA